MTDYVQGSIFDDLPAHVRASREHGERQLAEVRSHPNSGMMVPRPEIKRAPLSLETLYSIAPDVANATLVLSYLSFIAHRKRLPNPAELWGTMQVIVREEPIETLDESLGLEFLQQHASRNEQQLLVYLILENQLEIANFPSHTDNS